MSAIQIILYAILAFIAFKLIMRIVALAVSIFGLIYLYINSPNKSLIIDKRIILRNDIIKQIILWFGRGVVYSILLYAIYYAALLYI